MVERSGAPLCNAPRGALHSYKPMSFVQTAKKCLFAPATIQAVFIAELDAIVLLDQSGRALTADEFAELVQYCEAFYDSGSVVVTAARAEKKNVRRQPATAGYVYAVKCDRWVKIGITRNPRARLATYRTLPTNFERLCLIQSANCRDVEQFLHVRFNRFRTRGEWFELPVGDVHWLRTLTGAILTAAVRESL